jgi:hypothetical protein
MEQLVTIRRLGIHGILAKWNNLLQYEGLESLEFLLNGTTCNYTKAWNRWNSFLMEQLATIPTFGRLGTRRTLSKSNNLYVPIRRLGILGILAKWNDL